VPAVGVAFSGGRDSTALLHVAARAAASHGATVLALHVHHGLSPRADEWLAQCERICKRWATRGMPIEFASRRVAGTPAKGDSVEAWAREQRYRALAEMAREHDVELVLLAHHRRDQAETFLLQALRGGGARALAAMPPSARRGGITWVRPWLAQPREAIEAYVRRHRLPWIDDESNDDGRFARNRLRRDVWPTLVAAFADAEASLAAAAERSAHAAALLDEIAAADLASVADPRGLDLARWRMLSPPRRREALRAWLRHELPRTPPATLVARLLHEAVDSGDRRWPAAGGELRSYRGRLVLASAGEETGEAAPVVVDLSRPGTHKLEAWCGAFVVANVARGGIPASDAEQLVVRRRAPGDRFQAGPGRPGRSVKLQFQAKGVAPPLRNGPVVCRLDGTPVFVAGLGLDHRAVAADGTAQVTLAWRPGPHRALGETAKVRR
jgi:tRNA(Ile)-lysidine synthase